MTPIVAPSIFDVKLLSELASDGGAHTEDPAGALKPGSHEVHDVEPAFEEVSMGHCEQEPMSSNLPAAHGVHAEAPGASATLPVVHTVHIDAPSDANLPAAQEEQGAPDAADLPAEHTEQMPCPVSDDVPAVHIVHAVAPATLVSPAAQSLQAAAPLPEYLPMLHDTHPL